MAKSVAEIREQIAKLQAEEQKALQREIGDVVKKIQVAVEHYGLTVEQIFGASKSSRGTGSARVGKVAKRPGPKGLTKASGERKVAKPSKRASAAKGTKVAIKFRDDAGNAWSGRGSQPRWLRAAIEAGKSLQDFAVA